MADRAAGGRDRSAATNRARNNQQAIDELEYFYERLGSALFGPEAEDFRRLARFIPRGHNLSLLIDVARAAGRDLAHDFAFMLDDVRRRLDLPAAPAEPPRRDEGMFDFQPHLDLLARPDLILPGMADELRPELARRLRREPERIAPGIVRAAAYAWLELIGLPDLEVEFDPRSSKRLRIDPEPGLTRRGLDALCAASGQPTSGPVRRFLERVHYRLVLDYRQQMVRLAGP